MSAWLDPLRRTLDRAPRPVEFFFRDDDAGWEDAKLYRLLALFEQQPTPLDLAVIPGALGAPLAAELRRRRADAGDLLGLHQHGFRHLNHEPEGRKHEFGPGRSYAQQRRDLERGRGRLEALLGAALDPIFTPPWNRCTGQTARCLAELGYRVLSRDLSAAPLMLAPGLSECPISVDWLRRRRGVRLGRQALGRQLGEAAARPGRRPVGVMLHHAALDAADLADLRALLAALAERPRQARCRLIRQLSM